MATYRNASLFINGKKAAVMQTATWKSDTNGETIITDSEEPEESMAVMTGSLSMKGACSVAGSGIDLLGIHLRREPCDIKLATIEGKILTHPRAKLTSYEADTDAAKGTTNFTAEFKFGKTRAVG